MSDRLEIGSKEFFSNYMFHPFAPELTTWETIKAAVASVALFIFTLTTVHIACLIIYRNIKFSLIDNPSGTAAKVDSFNPNKSGQSKDPIPQTVLEEKLTPKQRLLKLEATAENDESYYNKDKAYIQVAEMYRDGVPGNSIEDTVEKDIPKAIELLKKAMKRDVIYLNGIDGKGETISALLALADIYIQNEAFAPEDPIEFLEFVSTVRDSKKKFELLKLAAGRGIAEAMYELGRIYHFGEYGATEKNLEESIKLMDAAANKGHFNACEHLAQIYFFGDQGSIAVDPNKGAEFALLALKNGSKGFALWEAEGSFSAKRVAFIDSKDEAIAYFNKRGDVDMQSPFITNN